MLNSFFPSHGLSPLARVDRALAAWARPVPVNGSKVSGVPGKPGREACSGRTSLRQRVVTMVGRPPHGGISPDGRIGRATPR